MQELTRPTLDNLANKYVTDKGTGYPGPSRHGYAPFYDKIVSPNRDEEIRMLEIGICMEGTPGGHSVYMWNEYFSKAKIFTFDCVDMSGHPAITQFDRVSFYCGDQSKRESFESMYDAFGSEQFNYIFEDGSHEHHHQMISFAHLFKYVKSGGVYFLEDASIPEHEVCCIRNDQTYITIKRYLETGEFISEFITDEEKKYLEDNIEKVEMYVDDQDAYVTVAFYKK